MNANIARITLPRTVLTLGVLFSAPVLSACIEAEELDADAMLDELDELELDGLEQRELSDALMAESGEVSPRELLAGMSELGLASAAPNPETLAAGNLVFAENFENGLGGWQANGLWHPVSNSPCGGAASGIGAAYFGIDGACNYNTGARASGTLTSPLIEDLGAEAVLNFDYLRQVESYSGSYDRTTVLVSTDYGLNWTPVWAKDSSEASSGVWAASSVSLAGFEGADLLVRFEFDTVDAAFNAHRGWMIDDVEILDAGDSLVYDWNGGCASTQVGASGNVRITKTPIGDGLFDVQMQGAMNIFSPTYGYVRHNMLPGLRPVSSDPQAYTCEVQELANFGSTAQINNYGGSGVHVRADSWGAYTNSATIWFPEKFYNGLYTLSCSWITDEPTDAGVIGALNSCGGATIISM